MLEPAAKALTLRPGAAVGVCPGPIPCAVGIFSVGMLPCGFASGMAGALPQAGSGAPYLSRRISSAPPPTSETPRAKMPEKPNAPHSPNTCTVAEAAPAWNCLRVRTGSRL